MKRIQTLLVLFLILFPLNIFPNVAHAVQVTETATLYPIADAYVDSDSPNSNFGGSSYLYSEFWDYTYINDVRENTYLMFNLSSIPSKAHITSANLKLYAWSAWSPTATVGVYYCSNNTWIETGITWNNAPTFASTAIDAIQVPFKDTWYSWNITSNVRSSLSVGKLTVVMKVESTGDSFTTSYYSKEGTKPPRLIIGYTLEKASSDITCSVSNTTIKLGDQLTVSGSISPALVGKTVNLTFTKPDGSSFNRTVTSTSGGLFTYTFMPYTQGSWNVKTSWAGDQDYIGDTSSASSFTVTKIGALNVWTFEDESMYTDYKVTVVANDTWEVGTEQIVKLTIEVTSSEKEGYIVINTIEMGLVLYTKKDTVDKTLKVGQSYTHTTKFNVTEEYGIYEAKDYSKKLCYTLVGKSYYRSYTGLMDSTSLFDYESWDITVQGIKPVMSTKWSDTTVTQGTSIKVNVTVRYPSSRPIEGCTATIWIDLKQFTSQYKGDGIYSITIDTKDLSGTKEFNINVRKSLYYDYNLVPKEGEKYKIIILIPTTITCEVSKDKITQGDSITTSGSISPKRGDVTVILSYKKPDGSILNRTATTKSDGSYSDSYKPDAVGSWSVIARFTGDSTYASSSSTLKSFTVEEKKGICFIATATYGSELSPEVQFLREFRDNTVLATFTGSQFMEVFNGIYYSFSPTVASTISGSETIRSVMKVVLYPLMGILHLGVASYSLLSFSPDLGILVFCLVVSTLMSIVYLAPWALLLCFLKKMTISVKKIRLVSLIWAGSIAVMLVAEVTKSSLLMMTSGGAFVLATACLTTLVALRVSTKRYILVLNRLI